MSPMSDSRKALETIKVSTKGLPPNTRENYLLRKQLLRTRRRKTRDALIYKNWLKADDKQAAVAELGERWSLPPGKIGTIIATQRDFGVEVATYAAEIEAIRQVKTDQVLEDADESWNYLNSYIQHLFDLKAGGETFIPVEETITDGRTDKEGCDLPPETKTKNIPLDEAIKRAYQMKAQLAKMDSETVANYIGRPSSGVNIKDSNVLIIEADNEFKKHFEKVTGKNEEIIDADAVVVDSDDSMVN